MRRFPRSSLFCFRQPETTPLKQGTMIFLKKRKSDHPSVQVSHKLLCSIARDLQDVASTLGKFDHPPRRPKFMRTLATDPREVSQWSCARASTRASQSKWKELHKPGAPLPTPPVITDCRIFVARARGLQWHPANWRRRAHPKRKDELRRRLTAWGTRSVRAGRTINRFCRSLARCLHRTVLL